MGNKRIESYYMAALAVVFILTIVGILGTFFAIDITPLFGSVHVILQVAIISLVIYIIIKAKKWAEKYLDAVTEKPNEISELRETVTQMRISIDTIGKKVDNIEKILENVPE